MSDVITHTSDPADSVQHALMGALMKSVGHGQRAYLLVDASKDHTIQFVIETLSDGALCLFDGQAFEDLSAFAPWLVPLGQDDQGVVDWFMEEGWGKDWGLFLVAGSQPRRVKTSLKRSLRVKTEEGKELFFKFYRPSVFHNYLPELEPAQACFVMRDLAQVWAEDPDDSHLVHRYAIPGKRPAPGGSGPQDH